MKSIDDWRPMAEFDHLSETARASLDLSDQERILKIRSPRWIGYTYSKIVLQKLDDLYTYPKHHRMPNLLIVGNTNNGKTMIVRRFASMYPPQDNPDGDQISIPVLLVQAPSTPDENRFYNSILSSFFAPFKPKDHLPRKQMQVMTLLKRVGVKILIIDEIHDILAGHLIKQRQFLNTLKYMGNELQIPIVGVGTKDALRALQTDPQLANRFEPVALPKWRLDQDFLKLLASFERILPLKYPSNLTDSVMAGKLLNLSEGFIGELSRLLNEAAIQAIRSKSEKIDKKTLDSINWVPPADRRRQVERVV